MSVRKANVQPARFGSSIPFVLFGWLMSLSIGRLAPLLAPTRRRTMTRPKSPARVSVPVAPIRTPEPFDFPDVPTYEEYAQDQWRQTRIKDQRVIRGRDLAIYASIVTAWLGANVVFWSWWFQPEHIVTLPRLIVATVAIAYDLTVMPAVFIFFLWKMKRTRPSNPHRACESRW